MKTFSITVGTNNVLIDARRAAEVTFTVTNLSGRALQGGSTLRTVPENAPHLGWLSFEKGTPQAYVEPAYDISATRQILVYITVPPDATPGNYTFRLNTTDVDNPDEGFEEGPTVTIAVPAPEPKKTKFPLWIIPIILAVLAVIVVALLWVTRPRSVAVPEVVGQPVATALAMLEDAHLSAEQSYQAASQPRDIVVDVDPPAGTAVRLNSSVDLFLSSGPTPTPPSTDVPTPTATPTPPPTDVPVINSSAFIAYRSETSAGFSIWLQGRTGAPIPLVADKTDADVLAFTPANGGLFALWVVEGGAQYVYLVRPNGQQVGDRLNPGWDTVQDADWSTNGQRLVVEAVAGGQPAYFYYGADGTFLGQPGF